MIAETSGGINGFDPDLFTVDTTGFANSLGAGHFYVSQNGNAVDLNFTPVPEPSTLVLLLIGAVGLLAWTWRRRAARGAIREVEARQGTRLRVSEQIRWQAARRAA